MQNQGGWGQGGGSGPYGAPPQQGQYGPPQADYGGPQGQYGALQGQYGSPQPQPPQAQGYGAPPQSGYGAPPQGGYGAPPQGSYGGPMVAAQGTAHAGGATVMGIPLEPGERVIYFKKHDYTMEMVIHIVLGVLFLVILIGLVFIYLGLTAKTRNPQAHIITNRRVILVPGTGPPQFFPLEGIVDLEPERQRSSGGGGLIGAALGAAITAVQNHFANQNHKLDPKYWSRTVAITAIYQNGQRAKIPAALSHGPEIGLTMARAIFNREAETMPAVQFLP
jgi:hypothetical protein